MFKQLRDSEKFSQLQTRIFLFAMGFLRRTTLGARIMLVDGQKILLIKHTYNPGWIFPGGGVEPGQSSLSAAIRELEEETGYTTQNEGQLISIYHNSTISRRDHVVLYVCDEFEQKRIFKPNREIADMQWFEINNLPSDIHPAAKNRINEYFGGAPISQIW